MSIIPDCRQDEDYNEKYLNEQDAECVSGYDICVKDSIENFFNNIGNIEDELLEAIGATHYNDIKLDEKLICGDMTLKDMTSKQIKSIGPLNALLLVIKSEMLSCAEKQRDEIITSMLDNMDDDEYDKLKDAADKGVYKNALIRQREYEEKYQRGEIPTYWEYTTNENNEKVRIGHCPNGNTVIEKMP